LTVDVEARYDLAIDWFEVGNPRTGPDRITNQDVVFGSASATVGGGPLGRPQAFKDGPEEGAPPEPFTQYFGKHGAKDKVETRFHFEPFGWVPGRGADLDVNYVFMNIDYEGSDAQRAAHGLPIVSKAGEAIAEAAAPTADWSALGGFFAELHKLWTASCDGVVAARKYRITAAMLDRLTSDVGDFIDVLHAPGEKSAARCGMASNYYVQFSLNRLSRQIGSKVVGGPFGGPGGAPFEERRWPDSKIVGGVIRYGARVDSLELKFSNQTPVLHGGTGGDGRAEFTLDEDERIIGISGRSAARVDKLAIHTTKKVIGPFGGDGGTPFEFVNPQLELIGILGRSATELDSIGGVFMPV
jgi:hypothetical protein